MRRSSASSRIARLLAATGVAASVWFAGPSLAAAQGSREASVTFTRDIAPIFHKHCTSCHRPGQIAPMSLLTHRDARPWSRSIRARVSNRTMPPWFADPGHRALADERRLNDNEMMTILAWVDGGALEGDPADLPPPPAYVDDEWRIGEPDAVFQLPREFPVPASGEVAIQYFEVPTGFTEDKWIQAVEVRPGDPAHVHHVLMYHRDTPLSTRSDPEAEPAGLGSSLSVYASGADPLVFPPGTAKLLPAGSVLVFEVHYTTNGTEGRDRTRLAVAFAKEPPRREVHALSISNTNFVIRPGDANARIRASVSFNEPFEIISIVPHAHRRGKSYEYRLLYEDGREETILSVSRYNWLWESAYRFAEPVAVPPRPKVEIVGVFDNSPANKANPDPKQEVRWGWDPALREMMFSYIVFTTPRRDSVR